MRALITGATGFIGRALSRHFDSVVALSRDPDRARTILPQATILAWQPTVAPPPAEAFDGIDVIVNLAGDSVGEGRWSTAKKKRLRDSRILATRNLLRGIERASTPPALLVSASAVGYYGTRGDETLTESSSPGDDFLAKLCVDWECEALRARELGVRVVTLRSGIVLGHGGPLAKMVPLFKLGLGGPLGSGRQWMSWVHLQDLIGLILHAAASPAVQGPVNAGSPVPVRNSVFTRALASAIHRPAFLPAPALALRLVLGEFSNVLLASQKMIPETAQTSGYAFAFPDVNVALRHILDSNNDGAR